MKCETTAIRWQHNTIHMFQICVCVHNEFDTLHRDTYTHKHTSTRACTKNNSTLWRSLYTHTYSNARPRRDAMIITITRIQTVRSYQVYANLPRLTTLWRACLHAHTNARTQTDDNPSQRNAWIPRMRPCAHVRTAKTSDTQKNTWLPPLLLTDCYAHTRAQVCFDATLMITSALWQPHKCTAIIYGNWMLCIWIDGFCCLLFMSMLLI